MADDFLISQIATIETQIGLINDALTFLATNPHKSYTLDTGQTRQEVSRDSIEMLNRMINSLMNRRATIQVRCYGATRKINPAF